MSKQDDFSCDHDEVEECAVESCDHNARPEYGRFCGVHKADYYKAKSDYYESLAETIGSALSDLKERHKDSLMARSREGLDDRSDASMRFLWAVVSHALVMAASIAVTYAVMR